MASEEEDEALNALTLMPSSENMVMAAEKHGIFSTSLTPLFVQVIQIYINLLLLILF